MLLEHLILLLFFVLFFVRAFLLGKIIEVGVEKQPLVPRILDVASTSLNFVADIHMDSDKTHPKTQFVLTDFKSFKSY